MQNSPRPEPQASAAAGGAPPATTPAGTVPATPAPGAPAVGAPSSSRVRLVLIGPPGAGKSTVGRLAARALGVGLLDTDEEVERTAGRTISEIFIDSGEDTFRALEHEAVARALAEHDGVLALGGGAVLHPGTQAALAGMPVVFLDVSMAKALKRVGLAGARPLLVDSPRARWKALMDARRGTYERVATAVVSTDGLRPEEVARAALAAVEAEGAPS
ncbi:shikimate kinase [Georgenia wangjunii]|uniref:shikimate kinase n=1 Tax=Georgenia wangjunii TaxID=3117730 RepID=UPI003D9C6816